MNFLFSCIGKRGYIAELFRQHLHANDRIIGTSNSAWTSGFYACNSGYILPPIMDENYPEAVLDLCKKEKIDAILSFYDQDVFRLSRYTNDFSSINVKPFIPNAQTADICYDKMKTFEFLQKQGIATARTFSRMDKAREAILNCEMDFPLFVKPRRGCGSRHTYQVFDKHQLDTFFSIEPDMIIQESLRGEAFDFDVLNDLSGRVLSVIPWRKYQSKLGETEQAETVESPVLLNLGQSLGTALGHAGPMDADIFIYNKQPYVLEINLRFAGGYPVSHLAGAGFPEKIIKLTRGETLFPDLGNYNRGIVMMKYLQIIGNPHEQFFRDTLRVTKSEYVK